MIIWSMHVPLSWAPFIFRVDEGCKEVKPCWQACERNAFSLSHTFCPIVLSLFTPFSPFFSFDASLLFLSFFSLPSFNLSFLLTHHRELSSCTFTSAFSPSLPSYLTRSNSFHTPAFLRYYTSLCLLRSTALRPVRMDSSFWNKLKKTIMTTPKAQPSSALQLTRFNNGWLAIQVHLRLSQYFATVSTTNVCQ